MPPCQSSGHHGEAPTSRCHNYIGLDYTGHNYRGHNYHRVKALGTMARHRQLPQAYVHVYTYACALVSTHIYTRVHTHGIDRNVTRLHSGLNKCRYAFLHTCLHTCPHSSSRATCLCACLCTYLYTGHMSMRMSMRMHIHRPRVYVHAYAHAYRQATWLYVPQHGHACTSLYKCHYRFT